VAGTEAAVLMVESEADQLIRRGDARRRGLRPRADAARPSTPSTSSCATPASREWDWHLDAPAKDEALIAKVTGLADEHAARGLTRSAASRRRTQACREAYRRHQGGR
jgi:polyribonucleotide nucleotidyltransferase